MSYNEQSEPSEYLDFMHGDCYLLAEALHNLTGLPLIGLWDGDDLHHVGVYDEDADVYIDARGELSEDEFVEGARASDISACSLEDMQAIGSYDENEYDYAEEWLWDNLGDVIAQYQ